MSMILLQNAARFFTKLDLKESFSMDENMEQKQSDSNEGIIRELGDLSPDTVVSEEALARIFDRHKVSVKRAIERGELPPSVRLFGEPVWTVRALREHLSKRLEAAKKEAEQLQRRISQFSA